MAYLKRHKIERFWPIPRKGTKYLAKATHNQSEGVPLLIVLREVLGFVKNRKELKRILNEKQVLVNHKQIRETSYPVCLFDIISLPHAKKNYRASLSKEKKMIFEEISAKEAETKIYKVISRKLLGKDKIQLNLMQGKNLISSEKVNVGDSVLLNLKDNKILEVIPVEKDKTAFTIKGKHAGQRGKIIEILERGGKKLTKIEADGERINVWARNIIVVK